MAETPRELVDLCVTSDVEAELIGPHGVTAEAEGVFILPRALRERDFLTDSGAS